MTECNECNGNQLYVGGRRRGDDSFPEKKRYLSVSTAREIRKRDREAEKFESLKYFGVRGVQGKEHWFDKKIIIRTIGTVIGPEHRE